MLLAITRAPMATYCLNALVFVVAAIAVLDMREKKVRLAFPHGKSIQEKRHPFTSALFSEGKPKFFTSTGFPRLDHHDCCETKGFYKSLNQFLAILCDLFGDS